MTKIRSLCLILMFGFSTLGLGEELEISNAWIQAIPPGSNITAAYMTILNTSGKQFELVAVTSPVAKSVDPMVTTEKTANGQKIMGMDSVPTMPIAPRERLILKPGGNHLMLMGLTTHPKEGSRLPLTLHFEPGNKSVEVLLPVYKEQPK